MGKLLDRRQRAFVDTVVVKSTGESHMTNISLPKTEKVTDIFMKPSPLLG